MPVGQRISGTTVVIKSSTLNVDLSGARIVTNILLKADAETPLAEVNVVTFSSRIYDCEFIHRGLAGEAEVRTDGQSGPHGASMLGHKRKQYLSDWTTSAQAPLQLSSVKA